jgi:RHS repeat-associated protein
MKSILRIALPLLVATHPAWGCLDELFRLLNQNIALGSRATGQSFVIVVPAVTTTYNGEGGDGDPNFVAASESVDRLALRDVTTTPATPPYGRSLPFNFNFTVTPLLTGAQTANVAISPRCGSFGGASVLVTFTYTGTGGTTPFTAPPTFGVNPYTGNVSEPVSTSTGELFGHDERADFELGGPLPLTFRRYYASYLAANGVTSALGANWMHNFDLKLAIGGTTATVTLFRGKTVRFTRSGSAWSLASAERVPYQLDEAGTRFFSPESNLIYTFDSAGGLTKVEDRNGNALTVAPGPNGPTSITDGLGRSLTFTYTGSSLTRVQDHAGRSVTFEPGGGSLAAFTDVNGRRTAFAYTSNANLAALLTSETRPAGNRPFTQTFDSSGRVASQTDSRANALTLAYTANGATVTEPLGVSFTQTHDAQRNLTSQTAGGASSQYTYDANGRPASATDRLGNRVTMTWNAASGRIATYTDAVGNVTTYTHTAATQAPFTFHSLTGIRYPDGATLAIGHDARGNPTSLTDPLGRRWLVTRNARGQAATVTSPLGAVATYTYGNDASLASVAFDNGAVTRFTYDAAGRVTGVTLPGGATRAYQYDAAGNRTRVTDERGNNWPSTWDGNDNLRTLTDALAAVSTLAYDGDDRVASLTDALGGVWRNTYDALGRLQSAANPAGNSTAYTYDNLNRPTAAADASGKGATFGWDQEGRLVSVTDGLSRAATLTRDRAGRVTGVATPQNERSSVAYDAAGRVASVTNALEETARYQYDAAGRLTGATLRGGVSAAFERNEIGQITTARDPAGNAWTAVFDKWGRIAGDGDPLGRNTTYEYDAAERLSRAALPQGSVQFTYDEAGNLTRRSYSDGVTLSYTYDRNGRPTAADGVALGYDAAGRLTSSNGLQLARDAAGRIASITYAAGKAVRYTYDNRGLLATVADWVGGTTAFVYDDARQLTSMTLPNGVREEYTYDRNGRVASIRSTRAGTAVSSVVLRRDAAGRVTGADRPAVNNPDPSEAHRPMAYDAAHQPLFGSSDALGRVANDGLRRYNWDLASRLTSYTADGEASFTYDALGQRLSRTSGGATQNYVWNYGLPLASVAIVRSGAADQQYYVWLPNGLLHSSIAADGSRRFYHFDESGSTRFLSNDAGAVTDTYAITPYGESVTGTGSTPNPFTFQGAFGVMQEGNTGLYYMRARYFDSHLARFLSRDPVRSADPRALNPYQFAFGNPVEGRDPAGTFPLQAEETTMGEVIDRLLIPEVPTPWRDFPSDPPPTDGLGGTWAPVRDIRFRGNYSRTVRAPTVSDLFGPPVPVEGLGEIPPPAGDGFFPFDGNPFSQVYGNPFSQSYREAFSQSTGFPLQTNSFSGGGPSAPIPRFVDGSRCGIPFGSCQSGQSRSRWPYGNFANPNKFPRWGDYSPVHLDPTDTRGFWTQDRAATGNPALSVGPGRWAAPLGQ